MRPPSLTFRLTLFWIFTVIVAIALAALFTGVYRQGAGSQISQATRTTQDACRELQRKFAWAARNRSFARDGEAAFEGALLEIVLDHYGSVEGGFWSEPRGFVAYAFPTYEGTGIKRDVPDAEKEALAKISAGSLAANDAQTELNRGQREAMITTACPIGEAQTQTAAWTMTRVPLGTGAAYDRFLLAILLLLGFVLFTGLGISLLLYRWTQNMRRLESAIASHPVESLPELAPTREPELDAIVTALNGLNSRLKIARDEAAVLARRLHQADRLAALGRMAAGIAHEIRNPLATVRLKFENAMVAPAERMARAAPVIEEQLNRVDRLIQMLLAMTQAFELKAQDVDVRAWLERASESLRPRLEEKQIQFVVNSTVDRWSFDPFHLGRAAENLLQNAIAFTPAGGTISVNASGARDRLLIEVRDSGPGISPEMRQRLFEPFASARPGGTGLGLLLVREILEAHGGEVREVPSAAGACFCLEVPWLAS